jgi:hypothetical protein
MSTAPMTLSQTTGPARVRNWMRSNGPAALALYVSFFALTVALQFNSGTYGSEFGHEPDEPAHVVSALMIHDYLTGGIPHSPLHYAETYYIHYPKVAIGMWPPVFHTLAALWMLVFPATHTSLLLFMAAHCSLLAALIAWFVRRWFGIGLAFLTGALFISFYLIQYGTTLFMLDIMMSLANFVATLLLIRFFKSEKTSDAAWFGLATSIALLVKGNAIALVLMPVIMIVLLRRWLILKRPGLYVSAAIVLVLGLPWQLVTMRMLSSTVPTVRITVPYVLHQIGGYAGLFPESTGYLILAVAVVGCAVELWRTIRSDGRDVRAIEMTGVAAMGIAIFGFHCIIPYPAVEPRYITPVLVPIAIFFAAGVSCLSDRLKIAALPQPWRSTALAAILIAVFAVTTFKVPPRPPLGYQPTAAGISWPESQNGVILISADGFGEGALVAEMALHDHRPAHIILRGSKVINEGQWGVRVHRSLLKSPEETQKYLTYVGVDAVVIDLTAPLWKEDTEMLLKTMHDNPQSWRLNSETPSSGAQRNIQVYRYIGPRDPAAKRDIQLRMRFMLGRDLKL